MISLHFGIEIWCNGSTTDFGSVCPGSNPGISTKEEASCLLFLVYYLKGNFPNSVEHFFMCVKFHILVI